MNSAHTPRLESLEPRWLMALLAPSNSLDNVSSSQLVGPQWPAESSDEALLIAPLAPQAVNAATAASTLTFQYVDNGRLLANPGAGWQEFGSASNNLFASGTLYTRFDWAEIEPVVGQYNFSQIDQAIASLAPNQRLAFRIMTFNDDTGPTAYANAGLAGNWASYGGKLRFQPNLNDARVQQAVGNLIAALGARYGLSGAIDSFDIGFFGPWGEWSETNAFAVPVPTSATTRWLVSTSQAAFPHTPVLVNAFVDVVDGGLAAALGAGAGWRGDSWGDQPRSGASWTNQGDLYDPILAQFPDQWKIAPIAMEPWNVISQWQQAGISWNQVAQWTIDQHVSVIHDKFDSNLSSAQKNALADLLLKIGYRPLIEQLSVSGDTLTVTIRNNGNAPAYSDHYLRVIADGAAIDTTINLKGILPGSRQFTITDARLATAQNLSLGFINPWGKADIQLAQEGTVNNFLQVSLGRVGLSATGASSALRDGAYALSLSATDSRGGTGGTFSYRVDWGDNSSEVFTGGATLAVNHSYAMLGSRAIQITATDAYGRQSALVTRQVAVTAVVKQPNAQNAALVDLVWTGTSLDDEVKFEQIGANQVRVTTLRELGRPVNVVETISGISGRLIARGLGGNDRLDAASLTSIQATLDGGAGNNTLRGGGAGDLLIGGSNGGEGQQGSNVIIAGNGANTIYGNDLVARKGATGGNNLILGGSGSDVIYGNFGTNISDQSDGGEGGSNLIVGGAGADTIYASQMADGAEGGHGSLMISGTTTLDINGLVAVQNEWTSSRDYATRVANLLGVGTDPRSNGSYFLKPGTTVRSDASVDRLFGDSEGEWNWFFATAGPDLLTRTKAGESVTPLG